MLLWISLMVYIGGGLLFLFSAWRMYRAEKKFHRAEKIYTRLYEQRRTR